MHSFKQTLSSMFSSLRRFYPQSMDCLLVRQLIASVTRFLYEWCLMCIRRWFTSDILLWHYIGIETGGRVSTFQRGMHIGAFRLLLDFEAGPRKGVTA
jgi:hypothetical protein